MAAIHYAPMTTIKLSGALARKFGRLHRRQIDSGQTWEVFKALKATLDGFADEIRRLDRLGMRFAIFRNGKNVGEGGFGLGGSREVRVVPVVHGSKRAGILQTVLGVALIIASFFVAPGSQPALLAAGIGSAAGGVIQMLSPQASGLKQSASPENSPSYAFGSAKNTTASGNPVPICIGERRWGGAIISASIYAEDKT
ncbi:tail assembly protein [Pseudomonas syringae]|uniref:Tail assembly protein n=1 Tax=Pseudomonas syringae pv. papulans TaxID=83963 RepID=A0AA43DW08_PSESX|nr:tail assembly protein [Pseudomonas syringae]KWS33197.1 phage tail protein [Pseudomonas syringae pv. papulans]MDH4606755.1 tail assembly protein [Pseudomonas syringae pv. papulans]MDH4623768.1 tail assembly protein [Pseudomonas syringae pv. papulans]